MGSCHCNIMFESKQQEKRILQIARQDPPKVFIRKDQKESVFFLYSHILNKRNNFSINTETKYHEQI